MGEIIYTRPPVSDYQKAIMDDPARFTVTEAATKTGKTASHIFWLLEQALNCKKGQSVWWVAPVFGQAEIAFKRMKSQIDDTTFFKANESKLLLTLPTGAEIHFKSAERPDNLYGDDVYAAVFDEFTRAKEEAWHALRSTLTATRGHCKFIGNVKGKKNWGYRLAQRAKQNDDKALSYHKITAYDAAKAGFIDFDEIEQAKRDLPEAVFNELYLSEANEDGSNPFGFKFIQLCAIGLSALPAVCYGIDLAKSVDYTVIIGLDMFGQVCHFDRFQRDWMQTVQSIKMLPNKPMKIDSTGVGDPITEQVQQGRENVFSFKFTQNSKQQIMEGLALGIQQRKVLFPEGPIKEELENFEFEYTRTGVRYCVSLGTMVLTSDLKWKPIEWLKKEDKIIAFDEFPLPGNKSRKWKAATVLSIDKIIRPCYEISLSNGETLISSEDHLWLIDTGNGVPEWRKTSDLRGKHKTSKSLRFCPNKIVKLLSVWDQGTNYKHGYLSGIFDGEGCLVQGDRLDHKGNNFRISFAQKRNEASKYAIRCIKDLEFKHSVSGNGGTNKNVETISVIGTRSEVMRFLGTVRPKRLLNSFDPNKLGTITKESSVAIESIKFIGDKEVIAMSTTSKTFIANGYASHNCAPEGLHDDCVCALALAFDLYKEAVQSGTYNWV